MLDILSQFDALGLGAIVGSLLFLAGLIWVLVDNRSFVEVDRRRGVVVEPRVPDADDVVSSDPRRGGGRPVRPGRPRRAA